MEPLPQTVDELLAEFGRRNREQCDAYDKKQRAIKLASQGGVGGSAHQALERAETTDEEPVGKPTMVYGGGAPNA